MWRLLERSCRNFVGRIGPTHKFPSFHTTTMQCTTTANIVDDKKVLRRAVNKELKTLTAEQMHSESKSSATGVPAP